MIKINEFYIDHLYVGFNQSGYWSIKVSDKVEKTEACKTTSPARNQNDLLKLSRMCSTSQDVQSSHLILSAINYIVHIQDISPRFILSDI